MTIDAIPPRATAQQKGAFRCGNGIRFFKKKPQLQAENNTIALLLANKPQGFVPMTGPLRLTLKMVWPYRKTEKKSIVRSGVEIPIPTAPDFDNLAKMICDAITTVGLWGDDSQVSDGRVLKRWGPRPYWSLVIERDGCADVLPSPLAVPEKEKGLFG